MKVIKLGIKPTILSNAVTQSPQEPKPRIHYPTIHIEADAELLKNLENLPESGTMTVEYCVVSKSVSNRHEGEKTGSLSIDIMRILKVKGEDSQEPEEGGEALDKIADSVYDEQGEDAEE